MRISLKELEWKNSTLYFLISRLVLIMILFTICRALFYAFNHSLFPGIDLSQLRRIFLAGMRFDLSAVLYFNLLYIFIILIPHHQHYKRGFIRWSNILFYLTNSLAILLNCIDFIYYRFTNRRTTMMVFKEFAGETNYPQLLYHFIKDYYYVGLILIGLITIIILLTKKQTISKPLYSGWKYFIINSIVLGIAIGLSILGLRGGVPPKQDFPLNPSDAGQYVTHPNDIAIVLNTPFTMLLSMDKREYPVKRYIDNEEELEAIYTPLHKADTTRIKRPLNIVVIMVESLGREPVGFYNHNLDSGKYQGYTPFLDSLCQHSYVFMNSYANSRISIEGSPAVAASIPSLEESYTVSLYSGNKIMSLASCLKGIGYQTYMFHGAPNGSIGLNSFARVAGFEHYVGKTEYNNDADFDGVWGIWDHLFLPFVADYHKNIKTPFFSFIFTATSHHPFKIPDHLKNVLPEGKIQIHKSMAYADYSLHAFFDSASKKDWFNNTLFVITGDHTCTPYHPEFTTSVGAFTVPIIFYQPGSKLIAKDFTPAQQIDIMPTILDYVGYTRPYFAFGKDLFVPDSAKFVVNWAGNSFQLINKEWVLQFDMEKTVGMYNLKTDPTMVNDLAGKNMVVQSFLEKQVKAFVQQYNSRMVNNKLVYPSN